MENYSFDKKNNVPFIKKKQSFKIKIKMASDFYTDKHPEFWEMYRH